MRKLMVLAFGQTDNPVLLSSRTFLATILIILLTGALSSLSFRYSLGIFKISHYYGALAGLFVMVSFADLGLIALLFLVGNTRRVVAWLLSIQYTLMLFLILLFVLGFFRKYS
jgi:hypothetical protein